ncbi:MAG: MFS transporter [Gaiellaceae bacterium]
MGSARAAVTVVFFAHGALFGTWVARIPAIQEDLALGEAELGLALLGATFGALVGLLLAGWIVSREGSRATIAQGLPVYALLLPALALASSLPLLTLALIGFGAATGAVDVAMNAHGVEVERRLGRPILSSFHAGWSFGGLAGAGAGAVAAGLGVEPLPHFTLAALVLGAVGLAASTRLLPGDADRPDAPARLRRPPRRLALLGALAFCGLFAEGAASDWSAVYLAGPLESGAGVAALAFAAFSVAMAAFRLLGDPLTSRWGPVALTRRGGLLACAGLALALAVPRPAAALFGFACMGAGLAAIVPVVFRAAASFPGIPPAAGIAALTTVGYSAFLVGPPVIGLVAEVTSLRLALVIVLALLAALALLASRAGLTGESGPDAPRAAPAPLRFP